MNYILEGLEPKLALKYFEDISAIPRGSYNEAGIADFIMSKAGEFGLYCRKDAANNVVVKKPATKGFENCAPVLFQAHTDMVCEKNADTAHDFTKDGLELQLDGDILTAKGTTLGADDGKGVAYMLALMDSDSDSFDHPPLEFLFTSGEEVGFVGAMAFDPYDLEAKRMIGLDAGPEDDVYLTSAGAQEVTFGVPYTSVPAEGTVLSLSIKGLKGGHSALKITDELGNANKIMGRILHNVEKCVSFNICSISGGLMFNAIPRESNAVISIPAEYVDKTKEIIKKVFSEIKDEFAASDPDMFYVLEESSAETMMDNKATKMIVDALFNIPNGIRMMNVQIPGLPVTSTNMGVVKTLDDKVTINTMLRSSSHTLCDDYIDHMCSIAKLCGIDDIVCGSWLSAWPYMAKSELRALAQKMYFERNGKYMNEIAAHGGLELGVFSEKIPGLDIVTLGCDHGDEHTITEWMSISSFGRVYDFIKDLLVELTK